jgi:hypothetical protein
VLESGTQTVYSTFAAVPALSVDPQQLGTPFSITFRRRSSSQSSLVLPSALKPGRGDRTTGNYGGLWIVVLEPDEFGNIRRSINDKDGKLYERERTKSFEEMGQHYVSSTTVPDDELPYPQECERIAWRSALFPVCNTFHELSLNPETDKYLG